MNQYFIWFALVIASNSAWASKQSFPIIERRLPPQSDIVRYLGNDNGELEAWEAVTCNADDVYLNYSRFPFGDAAYNGLATKVCFAQTEGRKFVGVSENADRLRKALQAVIQDKTQQTASIEYRTYATIIEEHPEFADLKLFFESM